MLGWIWFIIIALYVWGGFLYFLYRVLKVEQNSKD